MQNRGRGSSSSAIYHPILCFKLFFPLETVRVNRPETNYQKIFQRSFSVWRGNILANISRGRNILLITSEQIFANHSYRM